MLCGYRGWFGRRSSQVSRNVEIVHDVTAFTLLSSLYPPNPGVRACRLLPPFSRPAPPLSSLPLHSSARSIDPSHDVSHPSPVLRAMFSHSPAQHATTQLLQTNPSDRMSAYLAAGHSWLDPNSTIPARRRAVRLTVAEAQADRMVQLVKRLKSRAGGMVDPADPAAMKSAHAVEATAAAVSVLSESVLLTVAAAAELRAERSAATALDKAASVASVSAMNTKKAAQQEQAGASTSPARSDGGDNGGRSVFGVESMFHEAEEAVRRAEVCARRTTLAGEAAICAVAKWKRVVKP